MQGAHGYGYDAGAYSSAGGAYGYDAAGGYYSSGYAPAPAYDYEDTLAAGRRAHRDVPAPPLNGLELQPWEACPRNYVIVDQTRAGSRVMFHPSLSLANNLVGSGSEEEDAEEIDALLSSSSSEEEDVVSTGRRGSTDSACSSRPRKKKEGVSRMMRALRGIVPGGHRMDTPAVLDGAVRYLKELKLEAHNKLGVRGSESYPAGHHAAPASK